MRYLTLILFFISNVLHSISTFSADQNSSNPNISLDKKNIKILSIDGGGVRGIISAYVLKEIESKLNNKIVDNFDVIAGNSSGGIIALLLSTPDETGKPRYSASQIFDIYKTLGEKIFNRTIWYLIKSGNGWWDARYNHKTLENFLKIYLKDATLKDSLTNIIIPSYDIEKDKVIFFKSNLAKRKTEHNFYISDIARATSAAPTYFRPSTLTNAFGKKFTLIDGGVAVNNPTLAAYVHSIGLFGSNKKIFILSIGTGTNYGSNTINVSEKDVGSAGLIGWAKKIIPMMMYSVNNVTDYEIKKICKYEHHRYYRLQNIIDSADFYLDNASTENMKKLESYAQNIIKDNQIAIDEIVKFLNEGS